jgi:protein-tyrosine-phosphatase
MTRVNSLHRPALGALLFLPTALAPLGAQNRPRTPDSATVVFVCEHGTVKSTLAFALFRDMARERGLAVRAISRGTAPDSSLPPFMRDGLAADRLSVAGFTPQRFTATDLDGALLVVSFDAPAAATTVNSRVPLMTWNGLPSVTANYGVARDSIRARVRSLVDSLARRR